MPSTNEELQVNNVWASNTPAGLGEKLTLPSGQVVVARKLGIDGMLQTGVLMGIESLASLVMDGPVEAGTAKLQGHKKPAKVQEDIDEAALLRKVMGDPNMLNSLVTMADRAVPHIVIEPKVEHHQIVISGTPHLRKPSQREAGVIYTDQIDFEDKMYLFNWSTGQQSDDSEDLATFRGGPGSTVDSVGVEPSISVPAKRPRRSTKAR